MRFTLMAVVYAICLFTPIFTHELFLYNLRAGRQSRSCSVDD